MYVVKVGEFYVRDVEIYGQIVSEVELSKEIMRNFSLKWANVIAKQLNGEVIEINEEVTNE